MREKNREYVSAQERLSSEKVRKTISARKITQLLTFLSGAAVKVTQWVTATLDSIDLTANHIAAILCIPNIETSPLLLYLLYFSDSYQACIDK